MSLNSGLNPKEEIQKHYDKRYDVSVFGNIYDPVMQEIRDPEQLDYSIYGFFNYQPYLEGCDATFKFFEMMAKQSPTHGSCIRNIGNYAMGGGFVVERKGDGFSDTKEKPVSDLEKKEYKDFIMSWTTTDLLMEAEEAIYNSLKVWGTAYLECIISKSAGKEFITYKAHDADRCRYMLNDPDSPQQYVLISPLWTPYYLSRHAPAIVPEYPYFSNEENGVRRTMIVLKNKVVGRTWYGEPDSRQSMYFQYLEYQTGKYTVKGYARGWTAKFFLEIEGDPGDKPSNEEMDAKMKQQFTNDGDEGKIALLRVRPIDGKQAFIHEFQPNTDHEFHESNVATAESQIYKSHQWHPTLSQKTAGSLGNSTEFKEVFKVTYFTTIKPIQNKILKPLRTLCDIAAEIMGYQNPNNLSLGLQSLFADMLIEEAQSEKQAQAPPQNAN